MTKSIFITGVTGYIGGTVFTELNQNHKEEYKITALVRSQSSAQKVEAAGAEVIIGSYDQPQVLIDAAKKFDVSISVNRYHYLTEASRLSYIQENLPIL